MRETFLLRALPLLRLPRFRSPPRFLAELVILTRDHTPPFFFQALPLSLFRRGLRLLGLTARPRLRREAYVLELGQFAPPVIRALSVGEDARPACTELFDELFDVHLVFPQTFQPPRVPRVCSARWNAAQWSQMRYDAGRYGTMW